ncbi:MAG: hypothetical protein ACM3X0_02510 [Bacteroidota bacterium]
MNRSTPSRTEMIERLVDHALARATAEPRADWMRDVFQYGFAGYGRFSERQLRLELQLRGLVQADDRFDDESDNDFPFCLAPI